MNLGKVHPKYALFVCCFFFVNLSLAYLTHKFSMKPKYTRDQIASLKHAELSYKVTLQLEVYTKNYLPCYEMN